MKKERWRNHYEQKGKEKFQLYEFWTLQFPYRNDNKAQQAVMYFLSTNVAERFLVKSHQSQQETFKIV